MFERVTGDTHSLFERATGDANAMFEQAAQRFAEEVDGLKRMTGEMQHELESTTRRAISRACSEAPSSDWSSRL